MQFANKNSMRNIRQAIVLSSGFCHQHIPYHLYRSVTLANTEIDEESYETCFLVDGVDFEAVKDMSKVAILRMHVSSFCFLSTQEKARICNSLRCVCVTHALTHTYTNARVRVCVNHFTVHFFIKWLAIFLTFVSVCF